MIRDFPSIECLNERLEQAIAEFSQNILLSNGNYYQISTSIGAAIYPQAGKDYETLYSNADMALYESKRSGKARFTIYSDESKES